MAEPPSIEPQVVACFLDEAAQYLATLNQRLLEAEGGAMDAAAVDEMFRAAHSLKGGASLIGLRDVTRVTHRVETVLVGLRDGGTHPDAATVDALFLGFDTLGAMLADVSAGRIGRTDPRTATAELDAVLGERRPLAEPAVGERVLASGAAVAAGDDACGTCLQRLPGWMCAMRESVPRRVRPLVEDAAACERLLADARGRAVVAVTVPLRALLAHARGARAAVVALHGVLDIVRVVALHEGGDAPDAPASEHRLDVGALGWLRHGDARALRSPALPLGDAWLIDLAGSAVVHLPLGEPTAPAPARAPLAVREEQAAHRSAWLASALEDLAELEEALLALERDRARSDERDRAFRMLHRLKGSSAAMGVEEMARLAHEGESLLSAARDGTHVLAADGFRWLFALQDALQDCVARIGRGEREAPDTGALTAELARLLVDAARDGRAPRWEPDAAEVSLARRQAQGAPLWLVHVELQPGTPSADLRLRMILRDLAALGRVMASRPGADELERGLDGASELCVLLASAHAAREDIAGALPCEDLLAWSAQPLEDAASGAAAADPGAAPGGALPVADTVRVDAERLDQLLNAAGEVMGVKARVAAQVEELLAGLSAVDLRLLADLVERAAARGEAAGDGATRLRGMPQALRAIGERAGGMRDTVMELHRHATAVQTGVMRARMVPIGPLFRRFHRMVRDLCKTHDRQCRLVLGGEATELDKKLVDELANPLTHLIRNSVDHGIEPPAARAAAGKAAQGTIRLDAWHQGGLVRISVADDGRGLDSAAIAAKAVERGLVSPEAAARMAPAEIRKFIFEPGFSTAAAVTSTSGRGVGMDVVRSKVAELKGSIQIESEAGAGTRFLISLPLTLAMIDGVLLRIGEGRYVIPIENVREIVEVDAAEVHAVADGARFIRLRDRHLALCPLDAAIGLPALTTGAGRVRAVVTRAAEEDIAIPVDRVLGDEEVVVKPLGEDFGAVRGVSGATVLGDGGLALILDVHGIVESCRSRAAAVL